MRPVFTISPLAVLPKKGVGKTYTTTDSTATGKLSRVPYTDVTPQFGYMWPVETAGHILVPDDASDAGRLAARCAPRRR
jgi:hypothetical protein